VTIGGSHEADDSCCAGFGVIAAAEVCTDVIRAMTA
jgi:hypothetical protein